jgi:hypothetical protein
VAAVSAARADFKDFSNRCFPGAVRVCASLQVYTAINGNGGTNVVILVRNLQGWYWGDNTTGSIITRIGLTTPTVVGATGLQVTGTAGTEYGTPATPWALSSPGGLGGLIELTAGLTPAPGATGDVSGGIVGCGAPGIGGLPSSYFQTCGGGWVAFSFTTTNAWSADASEVAWLTQRVSSPYGPQGYECGSVQGGGRDACTTVTPEPVTMLLLGSGLAGVGGVGLVRRRRNKDVVSD